MLFDPKHRHYINRIQSDKLRAMAGYMYNKRIPLTYFGKAWSRCTNNWIYFDTVLNIEQLKKEFELGADFEVHENLDPKSGMERGFIDRVTGEGLMGKVK